MVIYSASLNDTTAPQHQVAEWFTDYHVALFRYLARLLGDHEQAADLVQETFIRALRAHGLVESPQHPYAWLCRIGSNLAIDSIRRRNRWLWLMRGWQESSPSLEHDIATTDAVRHCLARLSRKEAKVILMTHYVGLSAGEIADITGENISTVRVRLHRARQHFRVLYDKETAE